MNELHDAPHNARRELDMQPNLRGRSDIKYLGGRKGSKLELSATLY
jgi:hypothetical protein